MSATGAEHENLLDSQPMCIICNKNKDEKLKPYVSSTWDTVKRAAARRLLLSSDCYKEITIKLDMMQDQGSSKYHSGCHKNYVAVKRPCSEPVTQPPVKTRSRSPMPPSDEKGKLKGSCIFCPIRRKTVRGRIEQLSKCSADDSCKSFLSNSSPTP